MIPVLLYLWVVLVSTNSIDLVYDDSVLIEGFIDLNNSIIVLDSWKKSNNGYFGTTENGDYFYLIVTDNSLKIKIWTDEGAIKIIEPII